MSNTVLVVEPHPDDAFLSLGEALAELFADRDRVILSVFADERRSAEGRAYADAIGARYESMGIPESKMDSGGPILRVPGLRERVEAVGAETVIFPLGLQHPDHLRVALSRPPGALRYLDSPYFAKRKLRKDVEEKTRGLEVRSLILPSKRKARFVPIFKSQTKFFFYNPVDNPRLPEVLLGPVSRA